MISCIIPSYKDPYLHKTIQSLLDNARGEIEVIPVIDGYELKEPLPDDPRVKPIFQENTGMRGAINAGVKAAKGEFILRSDEHCMFDEGFDVKLTETLEDNWIVVPRRYFLDVEKWEIMDKDPVDFEKLLIEKTYRKFHGINWKNRKSDKDIDETMAMQGSCWVMRKSWWEKVIVALESEGYHSHYQDSVEMSFKTWKAGGKLMLNRKTWYAHKFRGFPRTHNYPSHLARESWDYAIKVNGQYYKDVIYPRFFGKKYEKD